MSSSSRLVSLLMMLSGCTHTSLGRVQISRPPDAGTGHLPGTECVMGNMGELPVLVAAMGGG